MSWAMFLLGIVVGIVGSLGYALFLAGGAAPSLATPTPARSSALVLQLSTVYMGELVAKNLVTAGIPGKIERVQVTLTRDGFMTIAGDDVIQVLVLSLKTHFSIVLQPLVRACLFQVHILHANLGSIPVTGFAATFEGQINQQLMSQPSSLPSGFRYCASGVSATATSLLIAYSAQPL
jgi:hypothetical protein